MLDKLIKIKSSYDLSQGKRKEDIKHNVSELRKLWDKHRPEYILMIGLLLSVIVFIGALIIYTM